MFDDNFNCIVAVNSNGQIIGFATYFFAFYSWTGKSVYLDDLFVLENFRGQQIGTRLMDKIFEIARITDCKKVRWQVSKWNKSN